MDTCAEVWDVDGNRYLDWGAGTEAVEAAIKLARYHTRRPCFIGFYGAFHGRTMGALAFTASKSVQRAGFFPMLSGVTHIPYPDPY